MRETSGYVPPEAEKQVATRPTKEELDGIYESLMEGLEEDSGQIANSRDKHFSRVMHILRCVSEPQLEGGKYKGWALEDFRYLMDKLVAEDKESSPSGRGTGMEDYVNSDLAKAEQKLKKE